jgi:hypothetical protein
MNAAITASALMETSTLCAHQTRGRVPCHLFLCRWHVPVALLPCQVRHSRTPARFALCRRQT